MTISHETNVTARNSSVGMQSSLIFGEKSDTPVFRLESVLIGCVAIFIACLIISSVTASKVYVINMHFFNAIVPVGTFLFALTFLATDVVAEIWGRKYSMYLVFCGFVARSLALLTFYFGVSIEGAPFWTKQEAYKSILGFEGSGLIIVAGIVAYIVSQTNDVLIFHYYKEKDFGKNRLYKRNLISTFLSQFLDSCIFVVIAFAAILPVTELLSLIAGQLIVKWAVAIADTPLVYIIRNFALSRPIFDFKG